MSAALNLFGWPDHIGVIGERITVEGKLILKRENRKGPRWLLVFQTTEKHQVAWHTYTDNQLQLGHWYTVRGKVVRHRHYREIPQTVLTRCMVSPYRRSAPGNLHGGKSCA